MKHYSIEQVSREIHNALMMYERAAQTALKSEFGFGVDRYNRFHKRLREIASKEVEIFKHEASLTFKVVKSKNEVPTVLEVNGQYYTLLPPSSKKPKA